LDLRGRKAREAGEDCIMRSFITCTLHQLLGLLNQMRWAGHVAYRGNEKWIQSLDQGKRKLGRFRYRWEDIKMDLN